MKRAAVPLVAAVLAVLVAASAPTGSKDPVTGDAYDRLIAAQDTALQRQLARMLPEIAGYVVAGPLDPGFHTGTDTDVVFHVPRVICATGEVAGHPIDRLFKPPSFTQVSRVELTDLFGGIGLAGSMIRAKRNGRDMTVAVLTQQSNRWLIWWRRVRQLPEADGWRESLAPYAAALAVYLDSVDAAVPSPVPSTSSVAFLPGDRPQPIPPVSTAYGLPEAADLFPPRPDYVIQGYQNYKDFLHEHADIETWFADGILAFVPTDSLLEVLMRDAPRVAWPNKEAPLLQHEFKKYFERAGNLYELSTLTAKTLSKLKPGEYFYAVGLNGKIRFAFETPREEVERIEREMGRKVPRANHAFLFPGEPILTAGAFFVELDPDPRMVEVNTHSGHYFYSNVTKTIRDDIAHRSDEYLLTIGHFLDALDREGISYEGILISKM
jgi:hypothetical protein